MIEPTRPSSAVVITGSVLSIASAFMPWFQAVGENATKNVIPATQATLQASVWMVVVAMSVGLLLFVTRSTPALIGCACSLWLNCAVFIWLTGARASLLVPSSVLPDNAMLRIGYGASVGLAGACLAVIGVVTVLAEQTWNSLVTRVPAWFLVASLALVVMCFAVREFRWFKISGGGVRWYLDYDVVPLVGDLMGLVVIVAVPLIILHSLRPRRWVAYLIMADAAVMAMAALIAVGSTSLMQRGVTSIIGHAAFLKELDAQVDATDGPWAFLALAGILASYAIASLGVCPTAVEAPADAEEGPQAPWVAIDHSLGGQHSTAPEGRLPDDPF